MLESSIRTMKAPMSFFEQMLANYFAISFSLVCVVVCLLWFRRPAKHNYPPGPRPLPILGNLFDFTIQELWLRTTEWGRKYGDVCYVHILHWNMVFVSSPEAASELLDKRWAIYSDRPALQMTGELCGIDKMVTLSNYTDKFKRQRRYIQQTFGARFIPSYHPMIEAETISLLHALIYSPPDYIANVRKYAGGLTLSVAYGYRALTKDDKFLILAEDCMEILANEVSSGTGIWTVDIFPFLKHMPSWFPGCHFQKKAAKWKAMMIDFVEKPFVHAKMSLENGTIMPSFCSKLLGSGELTTPQMEDEMKYAANSMFAASADSTATSISQFILAMLQNPEVMKRAQEEIDRVVGSERLPNFKDRENLPYVDAIMSEVWRWGVPLPLNLPHYSSEDDVYNGMFIPKGTIVRVNIWAILRNETLFPNPEVFDPERFLNISPELKARRDPRGYIFGFGRRRCPGADLVESSVWYLFVAFLATLTVTPSLNEEGEPIKPVGKFSNAVFRVPDQLAFDVKPRSLKALSLIQNGKDC